MYEFRKEKAKNDLHANKKRRLSVGEVQPVYEQHIQEERINEVMVANAGEAVEVGAGDVLLVDSDNSDFN